MENGQNNIISVIEDKVSMKKVSLVKIHLFIKLVENNISAEFTDRELNILSHLYTYGGVTDKLSMELFTEHCFDNKLLEKNSVQSIRNVLGKARELGVVKRRKSNNWKISDGFLQKTDKQFTVFKYILTDYAA